LERLSILRRRYRSGRKKFLERLSILRFVIVVSSTCFMVLINSSSIEYFLASKGLREGDLYLFLVFVGDEGFHWDD